MVGIGKLGVAVAVLAGVSVSYKWGREVAGRCSRVGVAVLCRCDGVAALAVESGC